MPVAIPYDRPIWYEPQGTARWDLLPFRASACDANTDHVAIGSDGDAGHEPVQLDAGDVSRELLAGLDPGCASLEEICARCATCAEVTAVGLQLLANGDAGAVVASDAAATALEELQFVLGEGPSRDAVTADTEVLASDLARRVEQWPRFAPDAVAMGIRAVFAFPLRVARRAGSLTFYCAEPRARDDIDRMRRLARVMTAVLLSLPTDGFDRLAPAVRQAASTRDLLHQAAGIVSVTLDCSIDDALARLRAHAYGSGERLGDVAQAAVSHRLRFD